MIEIIFQNEFFIVAHKKANTLSVPSRMGKNDSRACLGIELSTFLNKKIYPVHRLDYEVSGLILYAFTENAQRKANGWFENKKIFKTYEALSTSTVKNLPMHTTMIWECLLMKGKKRAYIAEFGKKSITNAKIIEKVSEDIYRFELNPITGRSHQLRFELYRHHYPILGDELYGSTHKFHTGIALKAVKIDFSLCPERKEFFLPEEIKISGLTLVEV